MAGVKGRSGRRPNSVELGVAVLFNRVWTIDKREAVVNKLHDMALNGNDRAAQLLLAYAYGKPSEHVKVEVLDVKALANETIAELQSDFGLPLAQAQEIVARQLGDDVFESETVA